MSADEASLQRSEPPSAPRTRRVLNVRVLLETLVVIALCVPAAMAWHWWQVRRASAAMLDRAEQLVAEKDDAAAAQYYFEYLKLRPDDARTQSLLAETYGRVAKSSREKARAVEYYYQALGTAPAESRAGLRRRLAGLLLQLRQFAAAEDEARELLKAAPNDADGLGILALALYGEHHAGSMRGGNLAELGDAFERARKANPANLDVCVALANIYRHEPQLLAREKEALSEAERRREADRIMDAMVQAATPSTQTYLARYRYRMRYGLPEARNDLATALKRGPSELDIVLAAAQQSRLDADRAKARTLYEHAIELSPTSETAYLGLGDILAADERRDEAVVAWRRGLEKVKESVSINLRLADMLTVLGRLEEAEKVLAVLDRTVTRLAVTLPASAKVATQRACALVRGRWLLKKGIPVEAIPLLRSVVADQTAGGETAQTRIAWQYLAAAYSLVHQWDQAATAFERAAALDAKNSRYWSQAASCWMKAGQPDMAAECCQRSLTLQADAETWLALAQAELSRTLRKPKADRQWDNFDKAIAAAKQATNGPPQSAWQSAVLEGRYAVARADEQGHRETGVRHAVALLRAAEKTSSDTAMLVTLATTYQSFGQQADADRILARLSNMKDQGGAACLLAAQLYIARREYEEARMVLKAGLKTLPADMRPALRREMIRVLRIDRSQPDALRAQLVAYLDAEPTNAEWVIELANLSLEAAEFADAEKWESKLRDLEGPDGLGWRYCRAIRFVALAKGLDDVKLTQASNLLAAIQAQRPTWPKAYVLQGMLLEGGGKLEDAAEAYRSAIRRGEQNPVAYQRLIALLLQTDCLAEAEHYLALLEDYLPDILGVAALRARLLHVKHHDDQIEAMVEAAAGRLLGKPGRTPLQECRIVEAVGTVYTAVERHEAAERWYRRLVRISPQRYEPLAVCLARQNRTSDAIATCQSAAKSDESAQPAVALAKVLIVGRPTSEELRTAEPTFSQAASAHKDDVEFVSALAAVRVLEQRTDEAISLYRQILTIKPSDAAALNNLAALLAEQPGKQKEAAECIDRAVQLVGVQPGLLDTKGTLLVLEGQAEKAVPLLQQATAGPQPDPRFHLHLAVAYDRSGEREKARASLQTARQRDVTRQLLTATDRQFLSELEKKFSP